MKYFIILTILFSSLTHLTAQDKKIAMLEPIASSEGVTIMVKGMVRGELTKSISREPGFSAFTRVDIDQMMKEFNFQESGMVNDEQRRKLGQMSGADYVCISKILKEGDAYYLEASLVHIETGKINNPGTSFTEGGIKNVNLACRQVAADMVGKEVVEQKGTSENEAKNTNSAATPKQAKKVDTNPNNFLVLDIEVDFKNYKIMVCDKKFTNKMNYANAEAQCENLEYGGYNDWRLPTQQEGIVIKKNGFRLKDVERPDIYWTSTLSTVHKSHGSYFYVWGMNWLSDANVQAIQLNHVRPVRDLE